MNYKNFLPILVSIIPFTAFIFTHKYIIYPDSFDALSHICNGTQLISTNLIDQYLFNWIPCNMLIIKFLLFCLSAICIYLIGKTSEYWYPQNSHWTGLMLLLTPFWYILFFQLENDQFSYPFIFASLYFFVRAKFTHKKWPYLASLLCIGIACIIWQGSIVFLIALGIMSAYFLLPAIVILIRYAGQVPYLFFAYTTQATENLFGYGILSLNWFTFGVFGVPKQILISTIFLIITSLFNSKFVFLLLPFLAIGWTKAIQNLEKKPFQQEKTKKYFLLGIISLQILLILPLSMQQPTNQDWQNFQTFENYKPQIEHKNDYGFGYYLQFMGYQPSAISGGSFNQDYNHGIILTIQELSCQKIKDYDYFPITNEKIGYAIYDCTN